MTAKKVDLFADFVAERWAGTDRCKVARILDALSPEQRDAALRAFTLDVTVQSTMSIARVLTRWGFKADDQAVRKHRTASCCCIKADVDS